MIFLAITIPQIGLRIAASRRYRKRYREIVSALLRHGFGFLVTQLGLSRYIPFQLGLFGHPKRVEPYTQAEHVRMVFEDLGTTFIKIGQILSTRQDLLPPEYIQELEKLLDQVPPVDIKLILAAIHKELGRSAEDIFSYFDPTPLASASIGQVHAARLKTGEDVVVKVKRPGVYEQVAIDLDIISQLANLASRRLPIGRLYDIEGIAREFAQTLLRELDYVQEGRNADRFRENFSGDETIYIPRVFWDYTTNGVIVLERLYGIRITDKASIELAGIDPKIVAERSTNALFKEIFIHGFFHADPHPANFFVMSDGAVGIVDFGMIGFVDQDTKAGLVALSVAVSEQDLDAIIDSYVDLGIIGRIENYIELRNDIRMLIAQYYGLSIEQIDIRSTLLNITSFVRRHSLRMPANLALLTKTVSMQESLVMHLDPTFKFTEAIIPYARQAWEDTFSPHALAKRAWKSLSQVAYAGVKLPEQLRRIISQLARGEFAVVTKQPRLDEELNRINSMVNHLIFGILTSAIIVSISLLLSFVRSPRLGRRQSRLEEEP